MANLDAPAGPTRGYGFTVNVNLEHDDSDESMTNYMTTVAILDSLIPAIHNPRIQTFHTHDCFMILTVDTVTNELGIIGHPHSIDEINQIIMENVTLEMTAMVTEIRAVYSASGYELSEIGVKDLDDAPIPPIPQMIPPHQLNYDDDEIPPLEAIHPQYDAGYPDDEYEEEQGEEVGEPIPIPQEWDGDIHEIQHPIIQGHGEFIDIAAHYIEGGEEVDYSDVSDED
jgi:hypothetical protein